MERSCTKAPWKLRCGSRALRAMFFSERATVLPVRRMGVGDWFRSRWRVDEKTLLLYMFVRPRLSWSSFIPLHPPITGKNPGNLVGSSLFAFKLLRYFRLPFLFIRLTKKKKLLNGGKKNVFRNKRNIIITILKTLRKQRFNPIFLVSEKR